MYGSSKAPTLYYSNSIKALCLLAKAIIEFNKGNLKESLGNLKTMVKDNPRSPSDIWFAIGLCYYRLGNLPKAKLSMDKTIADDPENSMALTAMGIIEMASNINDSELREKSCSYFERAFHANPRNPLCLRYLSEHFFFLGKFDYSREFAEVGLQVLLSKIKPERAELGSFRQGIEYLRS